MKPNFMSDGIVTSASVSAPAIKAPPLAWPSVWASVSPANAGLQAVAAIAKLRNTAICFFILTTSWRQQKRKINKELARV